MDAIQRYELIRPILHGEKTVKDIHQETQVPISTLKRYLKRFREGHQQLESLADKSHAVHSHPHWLTKEEKDTVVRYKLKHPLRSHRQIAKDLTTAGVLQISPNAVSGVLKQCRFESLFFGTLSSRESVKPTGDGPTAAVRERAGHLSCDPLKGI